MALFLTLTPFAAFATLMLLTTVTASLAVAAAIGLGLIGWDMFRGRSLKVLTAGSAALFLAIAGYHLLARHELDPTTVRVIIDTGLLTIALGSVAIRKPFTMQFAREVVEPRLHGEPRFIRTNYVLSLVWSGAFVLMLLGDVASIYLPGTPLWVCAAIAFAARNSATYFTQWYRKHVRAEITASTAMPAA